MRRPLKEALAKLEVGGITEPEKVAEGIQVLAVCAKTAIAGQTEATVEAREEISTERGRAARKTLPPRPPRRRRRRISVSGAETRRPLALTLGEPAGIGLDIAIEAWLARRKATYRRSSSSAILSSSSGVLPSSAARFERSRPRPIEPRSVLPKRFRAFEGEPTVSGTPGTIAASDTAAVIGSIRRAAELVRAGEASAIVTNPIQKKALNDAGFAFPGHTEFLGALSEELFGKPATPVMMLASPELRVVPVTIHIPLAEVPRQLTTELIVSTGNDRRPRPSRTLRHRQATHRRSRASIRMPARTACSATRTRPSCGRRSKRSSPQGIAATGPLPADTMFHEEARETYDAALCMYHDQALIPVKTLGFDEAVNVTLGLPFVRTSPDHGTALAIAGTGKARATSLIAALRMADALARRAGA